MKFFLISLLSLMALNAFAESALLDSANLHGCGGRVELRYAANGDLALKFVDNSYSRFNANYCNGLQFIDASSGRVIKEYDVKGTSYTLSQKMRDSLSSDCRLTANFNNGYRVTQGITVTLNWCAPVQPSYPRNPYSYELSKQGNCKLMINGVYSNVNVTDGSCNILRGDKSLSVRYEYSRAGHCKIMINNVFIQELGFADKYYCSVAR